MGGDELRGQRALEEYCVRRWPEFGGLRATDAARLLRPKKSRLDEGLVLEQRAAGMLEDQGYFVARCFPYQPVIDSRRFRHAHGPRCCAPSRSGDPGEEWPLDTGPPPKGTVTPTGEFPPDERLG